MADPIESSVETPEKTPEQVAAETAELESLEQTIKDAEENLEGLSKEDLAEALLKINGTKQQLYARAKKAEDALKALKGAGKPTAESNQPVKPEEKTDVEEQIDIRFLQRDGFTEEDIAKLKIIQAGAKAAGKNISLVEASNDDLFKGYKASKEAEEKRQKAQLHSKGSSGGSGEKPKTAEEREAARTAAAKKALDNL